MMAMVLGRAALVAACAGLPAGRAALPPSSLSVWNGHAWITWWKSAEAPTTQARDARLGNAVRWQRGAIGIEWAETELSGSGEAYRTKLILVRIDPRTVRFALDTATDGTAAAWRLARAPSGAVVAFNAGQFTRALPWGWVVLDGHTLLEASVAPLVSTVTIMPDGAVRLTHARLPNRDGVRWAFQSYPTLLDAHTVPPPLRQADCGIDVAHRDARLALGVQSDGRLLVAMTRFDALGAALGRLPFGLTTPEMAAVMGALGATDAVLLDGGISAQLMVRDASGVLHQWPGVRDVPLALVAFPK